MNGPKRPLFTTRPLPHVAHFSLCSCDRSCTSWISFWTSTASSALANGPQKSPSTCCQARSPSSTLSSSSSICAVNPTLNTSGNERFITCHTVSPNGVGANRRSLAVAYQRILRVEMMLAYVDGRPIPRRSSSFTRLASLNRGGGSRKQITPNQHFTQPPPRSNEASLVKELERLGIGRPSTYASIISTLKTRWYATAKDRRFAPTPLGETVWQVMKRSFPDVFEVGFTAQMEDELDKVEEGDLAWQQVLGDFWGPFAKALDAVDVQKLIHDVHDLSGLPKEKCPTCGSGLVVRSGRFGPFIACARYPDECRFTRPLRRDKVPDRPTDEICQECGAPMVIKTGRYGEFLACTKFPACKHTRPVPLGVKCPKCGVGDLAERRTRKGRNFFGCLRYPECDYSTWNRPVPVACPSCGFLGMEEKQTKAKGVSRKCLKCGHELIVEEAAPAESVAT